MINVSAIKYNLTELKACLKRIVALCTKSAGNDLASLKTLSNQIRSESDIIATAFALAQIRSEADYNSEEAYVELSKVYEIASSANSEMIIFNKRMSEALRLSGEEFGANIYKASAIIASVDNDLLDKERALIESYYQILSDMDYDASDLMGMNKAYSKASIKLSEIMLELVSVRNLQAKSVGLSDYTQLGDLINGRINFDSDFITSFIKWIKSELCNAVNSEFSVEQIAKLKLSDEKSVVESLQNAIKSIHPEASALYDMMLSANAFDCNEREGKNDNDFTVMLPAISMPYIFTGGGGEGEKVNNFIHEFGHALGLYFGGMSTSSEYMDGQPTFLAEFSAIGFEMIVSELAGEFDGDKTAKSEGLQKKVFDLTIDTCIASEFERAIYRENQLSSAKLAKMWQAVQAEYGLQSAIQKISGGNGWMEHDYIFTQPLYSLAYSIAGAMALKLKDKLRLSTTTAVDKYLEIIKYGSQQNATTILSKLDIKLK